MAGARRLLRPSRQGRGEPERWSSRWPTGRSSRPWPTPTQRSPGRCQGRCARRSSPPDVSDYSESDQQRARFPTSPRCARRARLDHQRRHEDRRRRGRWRRWRARTCPTTVAAAYAGQRLKYGPTTSADALRSQADLGGALAVARRRWKAVVAAKPTVDMGGYRRPSRRGSIPTAASLDIDLRPVQASRGRVVFARARRRRSSAPRWSSTPAATDAILVGPRGAHRERCRRWA